MRRLFAAWLAALWLGFGENDSIVIDECGEYVRNWGVLYRIGPSSTDEIYRTWLSAALPLSTQVSGERSRLRVSFWWSPPRRFVRDSQELATPSPRADSQELAARWAFGKSASGRKA